MSFVPAVMSANPSMVVLRLPRGVEIEVADLAGVPAAWLAAAVKALDGEDRPTTRDFGRAERDR